MKRPLGVAIGGTSFGEILRSLDRRFNPAQERLLAKLAGITQDLALLPSTANATIRDRCQENATLARACIERRGLRAHPHLAWRFLHRADEDLLLLVSEDRLKARALDVKTSFELNITEPSVRAAWLGAEGGNKGSLVLAIEKLEQPSVSDVDMRKAREVVRAALEMVNVAVDRRFWVLSQNVSTSVLSGLLLAATMIGCALLGTRIIALGRSPAADFLPVALLGAMGAYVSNLITRENFLFVQGGPFWRYAMHPVVAKPILSAFAALFVYAIAHSGLRDLLGTAAPGAPTETSTAFTYIVLAVSSGFAADKLLRDMIDRVLKRLEDKAEKTTKASAEHRP